MNTRGGVDNNLYILQGVAPIGQRSNILDPRELDFATMARGWLTNSSDDLNLGDFC
jgi:hypothetical protein